MIHLMSSITTRFSCKYRIGLLGNTGMRNRLYSDVFIFSNANDISRCHCIIDTLMNSTNFQKREKLKNKKRQYGSSAAYPLLSLFLRDITEIQIILIMICCCQFLTSSSINKIAERRSFLAEKLSKPILITVALISLRSLLVVSSVQLVFRSFLRSHLFLINLSFSKKFSTRKSYPMMCKTCPNSSICETRAPPYGDV